MIVKWLNIAIAALAGMVGAGYTYFWPGAKHDNKIEQTAEKIIEKRTGIEVDLTPMDGEPDEVSKLRALDDVKLEDATDFITTTPKNNDTPPK
jgi:ABC-type glycerol-3-phosphate transport system substrate-binding protein